MTADELIAKAKELKEMDPFDIAFYLNEFRQTIYLEGLADGVHIHKEAEPQEKK